MKTPDEIKKGLEHCSDDGCKNCPYEQDCNMADGFSVLADDALAYIQQLEAENTLEEEGKIIQKIVEDSKTKFQQLETQVPKWISVEEPPKVKGAYLVRLKYPSGRVWKTWNLFHPDHGWCECDEYMKSTLTHWMAFEDLPEPPKEV